MGQEEHLMSEFNDDDIVNGGYQENKGKHWASKYRASDDNDIVEA